MLLHFQSQAVCHASFTYSINSSTKTVSFSNTSTGTKLTYLWKFDDNTTSTSVSPTHGYSAYGTYDVCLVVHDSSNTCADSLCTSITISNACNADFINAADTGNYKKIYFTSPNSGLNLDYAWNFGDSGTSTANNPAHTYANAGTYTVCLNISKAYNGDSCTSNSCHSVQVGSTCHAAFNYTANNATKTVSFTNTSTGSGLSYFWKFGDNSTSAALHPAKTYGNFGTYDVCLLVYNGTGCIDSFCTTVAIVSNSCYANFLSSPDSTNRRLIHFNAINAGANLSYAWAFGDSTTSASKTADHLFPAFGSYYVCLRITKANNGDTCDALACTNVFLDNLCYAYYTYTTDTSNNKKRNFKPDLPNKANTSFLWSFGDSTISSLYNPSHTFGNGAFNVCLNVFQVNGPDTCTSQICNPVIVGCNPAFSYQFDSLNKQTVIFNNVSSGTDLTYNWTFGNGATSTLKNPVITYGANGSYQVCLNIHSNVDTSCADTRCQTVNVNSGYDCNPSFLFMRDPNNALKAQFINTSKGDSLNYSWNFGDGSATATLKNPDHIFANAGTYYVCLHTSRTSPFCSVSRCDSVSMGSNPGACAAQFLFNVNVATKTVAFINKSTGSGLKHSWTFGDGTSTANSNPVHGYVDSGIYSVCLYVYDSTNINCNSYKCASVFVIGNGSKCVPEFLVEKDTFDLGLHKYQFTPYSNYADDQTAFFWTFGDGDSSMSKFPAHLYESAGTYSVCLAVENRTDSCFVNYCNTLVVPPATHVLNVNDQSVLARFFPVPFDDELHIELLFAQRSNVTLMIDDITGREQYKREYMADAGLSQVLVETGGWPKGIYLIRLFSNGQVHYKKLIK